MASSRVNGVRPARGLFGKFGEPTDDNCVVVTIDGRDTFEQVYGRVLNAKRSVLIANYDLDPHLRFARNYPSAARHAVIKSACSKSLAVGSISEESRRYTLKDLLVEKARNGVEVKIIVWQPRLVLRLLPGADERGIDGRADDVEILNGIARSYGVGDKLQVKIDSTAPTLTSAHHEKIMVIDYEVGFCGGFDLSNGKWDTSAHEYESQLRDTGTEPWHDVHAMVRGPAVHDLAYHFWQRWSYADTRDRRAVMAAVKLPTERERAGTVPVVALRTWKEMDRNRGIKAWYSEMFQKAKVGIYIENQFPFQSGSLTKLLAKRLTEEPGLKVVIVGPMEPNLPGLVGSMLSKMSVNDVNKNLADLRKLSGGRVATYSLISQHRTVPTMRKQIYVHSKIMIVDDQWMTIGSANLDRNGTDDSSEVNLGITSADLAAKTRVRLWQEHTGGNVPRSRLADFSEGFDAWSKLARANGMRVAASKPITGSVYFYNFEEEGLPPPYPGAKGGNRFTLL